jgi:hypothetical protein
MTTFAIIPTFSDKDFSYSTTLNGYDISIRFIYNTRTSHYHITATMRDGTTVLEGRKLVASNPISSSEMFAVGLTGYFRLIPLNENVSDTESTLKNLPENYIFVYID